MVNNAAGLFYPTFLIHYTGIFFIVYTGFPGKTLAVSVFCLLKVLDLFGQTYGFKPGAIGLAYSGFSIGFTLSMIVGGKWADYVYNHVGSLCC